MEIQRGSIFRPETSYYRSAGVILILACVQFLLAVTIAEALFPGYSVSLNTLSDLGASVQPSALIFNTSLFIAGAMGILAVYLVLKSGGCRLFSSCLAMLSLGAIGVSIFPSFTGGVHLFFSVLAFLFGALAVLTSYRLGLNIPMVAVSVALGLTSLSALVSLFIWGPSIINPLVAVLGIGGAERIIVYPSIFYLTALGGYLACRGEDWVRLRFLSG